MTVEDSLDIFGSDPFGRDYMYGLSTGRDGQGLAPYGTRYAENLSQPTTTKKSGYLGDVGGYVGDIGEPRSVMSELSASSEIGGRTVQYPLIVPTLTAQELMLLHSGGKPTPEIYDKAQSWAVSRLAQGQDPFANPVGLRYPQPQGFNPAPRAADQVQESPRGFTSGLFSDVLGRTLNMPSIPRTGIPALDLLYANRNSLFNAMGVGDVQKTAERISYGQPLTTGQGMTLRPREEAINTAMTVIPLVGQGGRVANQAAMTAGRAGARYAERVVPQIMERGGLPAQLLGDISRGSVSPLDVYHGSPYTFPPTPRNPLGEFDASKIGTGEGAQSYGYGIYTAENPKVATEYKLAEATYKTMQGNLTNKQEFVADMLSQGRPETSILDLYAQKYGGSFDDAMKDLIDVKEIYKKSGNLYKVDLPDEKIATMLDWNKPMSEQRNLIEKMRKALVSPDSPLSRVKQFEINEMLHDSVRMSNLHPQSIINLNEPQIVERLRQAGIAGVKYFDEGSRNAKQGTRNFVVFPNEEKSMTILERNGMPATPIASPTYSDPFGNTIGSSIR